MDEPVENNMKLLHEARQLLADYIAKFSSYAKQR